MGVKPRERKQPGSMGERERESYFLPTRATGCAIFRRQRDAAGGEREEGRGGDMEWRREREEGVRDTATAAERF